MRVLDDACDVFILTAVSVARFVRLRPRFAASWMVSQGCLSEILGVHRHVDVPSRALCLEGLEPALNGVGVHAHDVLETTSTVFSVESPCNSSLDDLHCHDNHS